MSGLKNSALALAFTLLAAGIGLCAATAAASLLSAKGDVIALLAGELFLGEAEGQLSGAGTLAIHSQKRPGVSCVGDFTSSSETKRGMGKLHCSDGAAATFQFRRLSLRSGYGAGKLGKGTMNFTYGLTTEEALAYLKLPKGKKLKQDGTKLELVVDAKAASAPAAR